MLPIASVDLSAALQIDAGMVDACASEGLEHGNPGNMARPSSTHSSRLEALPNELKVAIFEQLVCDKSHWTSWAKPNSRDNLRNLCLVSKRVDLIARPLLYKKISIIDFRSLVKLYRTIAGHQHLAGEIKEIDLPVHCQQESDSSVHVPTWFSPAFESPTDVERNKLFDECYQLLGEAWSDPSEDTVLEWDLAAIMCFNVLARTVNLSTLKMTFISTHGTALTLFRNTSPSSPWESQTRIRHPDYSAFFKRVGNATRSTTVGVATQFLPRLETLTLRSTSQQGGPAYLRVEMFQCFLDIPSLKTVRGISDDGNWRVFAPDSELYEPLQRPQTWPTRRNITTLHLSDSSACQYDMEDIAQLFPCLEVFSVGHSWPGSTLRRARNCVERGSRRDLSTAFGKLTALRSLEIEIDPYPAITSELYNVITASLGPGNVLSLAQLPNLQRLGVPLYMFAHMSMPSLGGTISVPREVLPRCLRTLVLLAQQKCGWDDIHDVEEPCWDSMATALSFLESLGNDLPYLPHLESVTYCSIEDSCGHPLASAVSEGQDNETPKCSTTSRLQAVRASFLKQNVQFLLQEGDLTTSKTIEL